MAKIRRKISVCPNCGRGLLAAENFCPDCGQENTTKNVSLKIFLKDITDDFFNFDSRFLKTLRPFLFKPGFLTKEYNEGRRKLYFPPLRLYMICSFLYFIIPMPDSPKITETLQNKRGEILFSEEIPDIDINSAIPDSSKKKNFHIGPSKDGKEMNIVINGKTLQQKYSDTQKDSMVTSWMDSNNLDKSTIIGQLLMKGGKNLLGMIDDHGKEFIQKLKENTPGMVFCLLPFFALLMKLVYLKKNILYIECLIFSLHFHSFAFLMFTMENLLMYAGVYSELVLLIEFLLSLSYLYYGLKRYFQQKFLTIVWKLSIIGIGYFVAFTLTAVITMAVTLVMY